MKLAHYYNKIITLSPRYREISIIGYTCCHLSFGLVAIVAYSTHDIFPGIWVIITYSYTSESQNRTRHDFIKVTVQGSML